MKRKPKFPREYYEIARVKGVPDKVVKAYRKLIRHEMYVEYKEKRLKAFAYGTLSDIEFMLPSETPILNKAGIRNEALADALEALRTENECWYNAVMDFYFWNGTISYNDLAELYGVSKPEARRRVILGLKHLKKIMEKDE